MTRPDMSEMWRTFGRIGVLSFGGPAAQIALMHRILVAEKRWLSEAEYVRALSFCMLLPGPEAMQLATYAGWRLRGITGGLLAGLLFVLPGAMLIMALAVLYATWGTLPLFAALFTGIKACVVAIVIEALLRVARRALNGRAEYAIALSAFVLIFFLNVPFPFVIVGAALSCALWLRRAEAIDVAVPSHGHLAATIATGGLLWALPLLATALLGQEFLLSLGLFFSKLAMVTFGGAYAVLAYMAQEVVQDRGWLTTAEMIDALGLAETTPGPLILVTQFVGFLAAYKLGGLALAFIAALLVLWVTFVPCFLWIFAFAPYVEWIAGRPVLQAALRAITAAVVGVIGSLGLWFAMHALFTLVTQRHAGPFSFLLPDPHSLDPAAAAIFALSAWLLIRRHWSFPVVLLLSAGLGWLQSIY